MSLIAKISYYFEFWTGERKNVRKDVYLTIRKSFSFIYSLSFLEKIIKLLFLMMKGSNTELSIDTFWELEKEFLKAWGKERDIAPLKNLDEYLFKKHVIFVIGDKRVRLGDTPSRNLKELARKFPALYQGRFKEIVEKILASEASLKSFDQAFLSLGKRVSVNCFKYKTLQSIDMNFFLTHCPQNIKELYTLFCSILDTNTDNFYGAEWELKRRFLGRGFSKIILVFERI